MRYVYCFLSGLASFAFMQSSTWAFCLIFSNQSEMDVVVQKAEITANVGAKANITDHSYPNVPSKEYKTKSFRLIPGQGSKHCIDLKAMPNWATASTPCKLTKLSIAYFNIRGKKITRSLNVSKLTTKFKAKENLSFNFTGKSKDGVITIEDSNGNYIQVNTN